MTTSRSKAQGTRFAWKLRNRLVAAGLPAKALPEGGPLDEGDIEVHIWDLTYGEPQARRIVVEARSRQNMSLHTAMVKALQKEDRAALREDRYADAVWLAWERMIPLGPGRKRRVSAGPILVTITLDEAIRLGGGKPDAQAIADPE